MALPQLFSIGEMAKIFHLSVSSLRHYEALGLVTPEYVDPSTNYRYYSVRQFEPLNTIRYLRAMDMPLTEIADFLQNRDVETIEEKLRAQKAAVVQKQKEFKRIERKLDARLSQLQDVRHAPLGEITLIHSPALRLFWIDTALTAPDYSALELSTSRLAAAQAEALVFLGKVGFSVSQVMWKPKIKVGSRIVLMIAPVKVQAMENFGLPSARTRFVPPVVKIKNGNPRDVIPV